MERLVHVLEQSTTWVPADALATMLGTSTRSIRNYVSDINEAGSALIESSKEGYRLARKQPAASAVDAGACAGGGADAASDTGMPDLATAESRRDLVISRLVNASGPISVYDIADELYISESTLASSVMPKVRTLLEQFSLACVTHGFEMELKGRERDKRRLLGHIATHNAYGYFTSTKTLEKMFPDFDIQEMLSKLVSICQSSGLLINDYALSNLLVHLLVIIIRLTSNNELNEREEEFNAEAVLGPTGQLASIDRCTDAIAHYFEDLCGCTIPRADYQQIKLLIALSIERYSFDELNYERLSGLMGQDFIDMLLKLFEETGQRFGIEHFLDDSMRPQLILHMYNAYQRAIYHVNYPNPLADQIKREHTPVYDMAVYIAHRFSTEMKVDLNENEIAFIAFHIGAYLERSSAPEAITCIVIVEEYHDFSRQLVDDLRRELEGEVSIIGAISYNGYLASQPESDIVITTIDMPTRAAVKILIGPILTKQSLRKIRSKLGGYIEERRIAKARAFLIHAFRKDLYMRNVPVSGSDQCIDMLGKRCVDLGVTSRKFIGDVHLREQVSSTAFTDCLALPHTISESPVESFIAVVHNDVPIPWGRHNVHFVLLIGIAQDEMGHFRDALDIIIDLFSSMDKTAQLLRTQSFDEFLEVFTAGTA